VRSPAAAIAWSFRRRHRWGLMAIAAAVLWQAALKLLTLARGFPLHLDREASFAVVVIGPMSVAFMYLVAVFTFGLDGDLAARESLYPARMFTRPVTTTALAWWPMFYGTLAVMVLWTATRLLAAWPASIVVPAVWPGLLAVVQLAWAQALMWMPYGLRGTRVLMASLWLASIDTIAILALYQKASEPVMAAILVPQIPLAYLLARYAVARARRGDVPDWHGGFARVMRSAAPREQQEAFPSAALAQAWFERRRGGVSLPAWIAILLPLELSLLWAVGESTTLVVEILLAALATPMVIATFTATTVSGSSREAGASFGLPAFVATRPMTSTQLVAAKLRLTVRSTILAWLLVAVAVPIAIALSGASTIVAQRSREVADAVGTPRAVVFALLVVAGFVASTWKQLVQSLYIGLTGREWLIKGSVFVALTILFLIALTGDWIYETGRVGALFSTLPLILSVLAALKMIAAAWVATRLYRDRLVSDRTLVAGAAGWSLAVFALFGLLAWMFDSPHIPRYFLMLVAMLAIPLARVSAAPLALAWNRHR
jgi:hypothetical protein